MSAGFRFGNLKLTLSPLVRKGLLLEVTMSSTLGKPSLLYGYHAASTLKLPNQGYCKLPCPTMGVLGPYEALELEPYEACSFLMSTRLNATT